MEHEVTAAARRSILKNLGILGAGAMLLAQTKEAKAAPLYSPDGFTTNTSAYRGLDVLQQLPAQVGGGLSNSIDVQETINSYATPPWLFINALNIHHSAGGTKNSGGRNSLEVRLEKTSAFLSDSEAHANFVFPPDHPNVNRNYCAAAFTASANTTDTGTDDNAGSRGAVFAINPVAHLEAGATHYLGVHGGEFNVACYAGASVRYKSGLTIAADQADQVQGRVYDGALSISSNWDGSSAPPAVGWMSGILFSDANGANPVHSTGTLIQTMGTATVANALDFSSYDFTGRIIKTRHFEVLPEGQLEMGRKDNVASLPYIDMHSSGANVDYDSRILAAGGNGSLGGGTLYFIASVLALQGTVAIQHNNAWKAIKVRSDGVLYVDMP